MKWCVGDWSFRNGVWSGPAGTIAAIDLRPVPLMAQTSEAGRGLFILADAAPNPEGFDLLDSGSWHDIKATDRIRSAMSVGKNAPSGDTLARMVWSWFSDLADPTGDAAPKPLDAKQDGMIELSNGVQQVRRRIRWGTAQAGKLKAMRRIQMAQMYQAALNGDLKDSVHYRRVLDDLCIKYGLKGADDWKELVPLNLQADFVGRIDRETTVSDDFNRSNSGTLGASWTEIFPDADATLQIVSNQCHYIKTDTSSQAFARYESDLSSTDQYAYLDAIGTDYSSGNGAQQTRFGGMVRFSSSATTGYYARVDVTNSVGYVRLYKVVAGSVTQLSAGTATTQAFPFTARTRIDGSTLGGQKASQTEVTITDTSITTGLRTGIMFYCQLTGSQTIYADNFIGQDINGGGPSEVASGNLLVC